MDAYSLAICQACINVTNKLMLHSSTRDYDRTGGLDVFGEAHSRAIRLLRDGKTITTEQTPTSDMLYNRILRSTKFSTGNCGEFTLMCSLLLYIASIRDPHLCTQSIRIYQGHLVNGDHSFCIFEQRLSLVPAPQFERTIVDAWGNKIMPWDRYEDYVKHTYSPYFKPNSKIEEQGDLSEEFHDTEEIYWRLLQQYAILDMLNAQIGELTHQPDYRYIR